MRNKLTLSQINQIIDNHIESNVNFLFVVDMGLALYLSEYLEDYGIEDETMCLTSDIDEYYVSVCFDEKEVCMFIEDARCGNGKYKLHEVPEWTDYFIFTDMSEFDVNEYLCGHKATWSYCEYVEDDEVNNELEADEYEEEEFLCDCIDCTLDKYVEMIQEVAPCPHCIRNVLSEFLVCVVDHTSPRE